MYSSCHHHYKHRDLRLLQSIQVLSVCVKERMKEYGRDNTVYVYTSISRSEWVHADKKEHFLACEENNEYQKESPDAHDSASVQKDTYFLQIATSIGLRT